MVGDPVDPAAVDVFLAHGIVGEMSADWVSEKLYGDAVVLQRMIELVGLGDRYAKIAGVAENQRGSFDLRSVGDGRLVQIRFHVVFEIERPVEGVPDQHTAIAKIVLIDPIGDRRASQSNLPNVIVADEPARHVAAIRPAGDGDARIVDEAELFDY